MQERRAMLFVGACGIAVRAIAPYVKDKTTDSPVLVIDEQGAYVIPILSGHLGGANELAAALSEKINAIPVITTATDLNRKFAVDVFAKRNGLFLMNREGIVKVSSKVLEGETITLAIEAGHMEKECQIPDEVRVVSYPTDSPVDIVITSEKPQVEATVWLKPREYVIGMGCRRGKEAEKIEAFICRSIKEAGVSIEQIFALASIEQKKEEQGFLSWSRKQKLPFLTYQAEELQQVHGTFQKSAFVKERVGVDNVCERAALKACGSRGKLIYEKHAEDGMTIAITKREWSVNFDEA